MNASSQFWNTLYFGFGSNLGRQQMAERCAASEYVGIARLSDFAWIINERGYATVIDSKDDEVWALVYNLEPNDEDWLDLMEGVPIWYTKERSTWT